MPISLSSYNIDPIMLPSAQETRAARNALLTEAANKLTLQKAQQEMAQQNALAEAYRSAYDPTTGEINYNALPKYLAASGHGELVPNIEKTRAETRAAGVDLGIKQQKYVADALTNRRAALGFLDLNSPDLAQQALAWHLKNHADPVLGPWLASQGSTPETGTAAIVNAAKRGPDALKQYVQQMAIGVEKAMKMNKPGAKPELVQLQQAAAALPVGDPQRAQLEAAIRLKTTREPRQPTEFESALSYLPEKDRPEAVRRKLLGGGSEGAPVQVVDPTTGNVVYATREQAVGMTPPSGIEGLTPKDKQLREKAYPKATAAVNSFDQHTTRLVKDLETLRDHPGLESITGIAAGRLPGVTAKGREAEALYKKIMATGGFQELQNIRDASPTGGAVGQVSDFENRLLQSKFGALDRTQDASSVRNAINEVISQLKSSRQNIRDAYDLTYEYRGDRKTEPVKIGRAHV